MAGQPVTPEVGHLRGYGGIGRPSEQCQDQRGVCTLGSGVHVKRRRHASRVVESPFKVSLAATSPSPTLLLRLARGDAEVRRACAEAREEGCVQSQHLQRSLADKPIVDAEQLFALTLH